MSQAYDKAVKRVNEMSEAVLAELISRDVQQLTERALDDGVTAYLARPVQRERPNERFLQSTIRGVESSNRREQEQQLWNAHRAHQRLQKPARQQWQQQPQQTQWQQHDSYSSSSGDSREESPPAHTSASADQGLDDLAVLNLLARRRVKGRGAIGPRIDETGPYLPPGEDDDREPTAAARPALGPDVPSWVRRDNDAERTTAGPSAQAMLRSARLMAVAREAVAREAVERKEKKRKKKRKEKLKTAKEGKVRKKEQKSKRSA